VSGQTPEISIIIPTYNRAETLAICLQALAAQTVPAEAMEIIVVDDGSTDDTAEVVAREKAGMAQAVIYQYQENAGANAARNRAIDIASAPLLLIINDDTIAVPDLVARHLAFHRQHPELAWSLVGRMTISPDVPFSLFHDLHHDASFNLFDEHEELDWTAFFTCNLSVKTELLRTHGYFDTNLRWHEDIELGLRLRQHGLRVFYDSAALGYHYHFLGEAAYLRIAEREGEALALWYLKDPDALDDLTALGFHSSLMGTVRGRHRLADAVLNIIPDGVTLAIAQGFGYLSPSMARNIYRKVFQWKKRRTIDTTLAASAHGRPNAASA
jgi:GT2 family glycosyltransferase